MAGAEVAEYHWSADQNKLMLDYGAGPSHSIDDYMHVIAMHMTRLDIVPRNGFISLDLELDRDRTRFSIADREERSRGEVYAVDLRSHVHCDISLGESELSVDKISGLEIQVKLPLVPDALHVRSLSFDLEHSRATVRASAVWRLIVFTATADVLLGRVDSIDWYAPFLRELPRLLAAVRF